MFTKVELKFLKNLLEQYYQEVLVYSSCDEREISATEENLDLCKTIWNYYENRYCTNWEKIKPFVPYIRNEHTILGDSELVGYFTDKIERLIDET